MNMKTYIKPNTEIVETNVTADFMQLGFSNDTGDGDWQAPRRKDLDYEDEGEDYGW